jgi:glycosyltransferase involved in cell wall biosynthesis
VSISPLVSILLPVRNAEKTLALAISSIRLQTYPTWELIIIDDGSTDGTVTVAQSFHDARIRVVYDGKKLGLATRLNQGLDMCRGDYIARIDGDDIAYPQRLERQTAFMQKNRHIDLLGTGAMVFGQDGIAVGKFPVRETHAEICKNPWSGFYLAHPTWLGKAGWFRKYRYRPTMKKAQDQDLLLRSFETSEFACLPDILTGYRQEFLSIKKTIKSRYYFSKALGREAIRRKIYPLMVWAMIAQMAKGGVDALAISTGQQRNVLKHRALPASKQEVRGWTKCWTLCNEAIQI